MLDAQGHIKIGDFGFAKVIDETAKTFCGTPAYMAPEIIMKHAYTQVVDWWSVGIVCYELMAGYSPFQAESPNKIYAKVIDRDMRWSSQIQEVGKDLIMRLLESDPEKRLGAIAGGEEVRMHSWFRGVNWKKVEDKKIPVPFVPTLNGDDDFSNFDKFDGENSVIGMQSEEGALKTDSDDVFKDF
jgi:serine/threonine protein kinase